MIYAILRQRNFLLLWLGGLISMLGDWMLVVALPVYVYSVTRSVLATGTMFLAQTLPHVLLGFVNGVFIDRWNKQYIMIVADISRALTLLLLFFVHSTQALWVVYLVTALLSGITQFFDPAKDSLLPRLVGKDALMAANSLNSTSRSLTRLIGMACGGILMGLLGIPFILLFDSVSFLFSCVCIWFVHVPVNGEERSTEATSTGHYTSHWLRQWKEGLALVGRDRKILGIFLISLPTMFAEGILMVLFVVFVESILHGGAEEFGFVLAAQGIGGITGGLLIAHANHTLQPERIVGVSGIIVGVLLLLMFNIPSYYLALLLSLFGGVAVVGLSVGMFTLLQTNTSDRFRGRILSTFGANGSLMTLLGVSAATFISEQAGVVLMLNVAAICNLVAGLLAFFCVKYLFSSTLVLGPESAISESGEESYS